MTGALELVSIGVDPAAGKGAHTALVALRGSAILVRRSWRGSPPTAEVMDLLVDLAESDALSSAVAVVEGAWLGRNPQTTAALAMEAGGWVRMLQAVGIPAVRVAQPSEWRRALPKGRGRGVRAGEKEAARAFARMVLGAVAEAWTEHECEAACMALWGAREAEQERRLHQAAAAALGGRGRRR